MSVDAVVTIARFPGEESAVYQPEELRDVLSIDFHYMGNLFRVSTEDGKLRVVMNGPIRVYPRAANVIEIDEEKEE